jgi:hypothetical protein
VRDLFLFALGWWHFILNDVRRTRTRDSHCERDHILSLSLSAGSCGGIDGRLFALVKFARQTLKLIHEAPSKEMKREKWQMRRSRKMDRNVATQG